MNIILLQIIFIGFLQAVMQGLLFYNSFALLDKKYNVKWFSKNTNNQNEWHFKIGKKRLFLFKYFPFIMFVDLFHLAHGFFGIYFGIIIGTIFNGVEIEKIVMGILASLIYSVSFEYGLRYMKKIKTNLQNDYNKKP